ncbi:sigma-70 family RNA polymerase sigma factor [Lysinibacillus sp. 54212]|uniref:sigma-70 family RNA polymerase sigma factor n=1 Tax=Lysinibacillus sp. 54212 TaxID=3119829 RepID=UPI002FC76E09
MDEKIIKRAIARDENAILQLLDFYEDTLYRTAYAYLKNEHDALDAMQELTYCTLKKLHTVKEPQYVRTWLMRVLLNICHDMNKKRKDVPFTDRLEGEATLDTDIEILQIIEGLPLREQEVIYLKYFQGLQNNEIAKLQNVPEGTVKSRVHSALKRLRSIVGQRGEL